MYTVKLNREKLESNKRMNNMLVANVVSKCTLHRNGVMSDFGACYVREMSKRFVIRALKTTYQNQAHKRIRELLNAAQQFNRIATTDDYEVYAIEKAEQKKPFQTQKKRLHTYRIEKLVGIDKRTKKLVFKRVRVPIKPYETLDVTQAATEIWLDEREQLNKLMSDTGMEDLISVATIAIFELFAHNLIFDYSDIFDNRAYVFKRIHNAITRMKNNAIDTENFRKRCVFTDKDGNEIVYTGKHVDSHLNVTTQAIFDTLRDIVNAQTHKNFDTDKALKALELCNVRGYTQAQAAKMLGCNQKQISRWIVKLADICDNAATRQALSELI